MGNRFLQVLACGIIRVLALAASAVYADGELDLIVKGLPGYYETSRVLERADKISVTMMRPRFAADSSGPAEAGTEIQYHAATYTTGEDAVSDFDGFLLKGLESGGFWQVVLQTRAEIHWLRGQCLVTEEQFRDVYAGAVAHVEDKIGSVVSAILCECDAPCRRIGVAR
jgi:hypothetical protein